MEQRSTGILESANKHELVRTILRHKLLAVSVIVMGLAVSALYTASRPIEFRSVSSVLIENYNANMMAIQAEGFSYTQDVTKAQRVLAQTRPVITRIMAQVPEEKNMLLGSPENALPGGFETRVDGQLLYLQVVDVNAARAAKLSNAWAEAFVTEMTVRAQGPKEQFEGTVRKNQQEWIKKHQALLEFEKSMNFNPREFEQIANPVRTRYQDLSTKLNGLNIELATLQAEQKALEAGKDILQSARARTDPVVQGALKQVELRQAKVIDLRERYAGGSSEVKAVEKSLEDALSNLREGASTLRSQIQLEVERVRSERDQISAIYKEAEVQFEDLKTKAAQHAQLSREEKAADRIYTDSQQRKGETEITRLFESNARSWEQAEVSKIAFRPNWRQNLTMGFFLSIAAAIGLCYVLERMDDTVRTTRDLERHLGVATLGMVPMFERTLADADGYLLAQRQAGSVVVDSLRNIHIGLEVANTKRNGQPLLITITSAAPNEGKSFLASNLATLFAGLGRRVLVVDADLRKGSLTKAFKCHRDIGLREAIASGKWSSDMTVNGVTPGYNLLPVGKNSHENPESLSPEGFKHLLAQMKNDYDVIIFDTPPVLAVADACVIGSCTDVTLLLSRSRCSRLAQVERAAAVLYSAGIKQVQFVVNGVDASDASTDSYGYGYGYGYGGYGYGYGNEKKGADGRIEKILPALAKRDTNSES